MNKQIDKGADQHQGADPPAEQRNKLGLPCQNKDYSTHAGSNWVVFLFFPLPNLLHTVAFLLMLGRSVQLAKGTFHWSPSETLPGKVNDQKWKELINWNQFQQHCTVLRSKYHPQTAESQPTVTLGQEPLPLCF